MGNYVAIGRDIRTLNNAVMNLSGRVAEFKNAKKVIHELARIQAILENVDTLLLEG